jgi:hypothetical protein
MLRTSTCPIAQGCIRPVTQFSAMQYTAGPLLREAIGLASIELNIPLWAGLYRGAYRSLDSSPQAANLPADLP